jgi:hypothetical protein
LQLSSLPATETFKSHTDNALKTNSVTVNSNSFTIAVPKLSTTAVLLSRPAIVTGVEEYREQQVSVSPNPAFEKLVVGFNSKRNENVELILFDQLGRRVASFQKKCDGINPITVDISTIPNGFYLLSLRRTSGVSIAKVVVAR